MSLHSNPTAHPAAELVQAAKRYGDVVALDGVDLAVRPGEVVALLGPNGAGKTTAVSLLLGLLAPDGGQAQLFGQNPRSPAARMRAGAMLQVSKVPDTLTVAEHLTLFASYYPAPLPVAEAVALAGLEGLERRHYGKLSGGQKQRLIFALALIGDPDLLFLDEPTVGLDVASRRTLWERIRELVQRGRTVLLTTHYLEEAEALADRIVVIDRGRIIAEGTPSEIEARAGSRRVRCRTRVEVGEVLALDGVVRAERRGDEIEVLATAAEPVVRHLLAHDPHLARLEVRGAGLEEAFLTLTRHDDDSNQEAA
ncbi:MAG TPA: ABC transporter ATP-binding protein [Thermoanaerobaculia bacterium]|nr:ABC transporter ATP-binding protein [Thermoanaerobaculia bacterium]